MNTRQRSHAVMNFEPFDRLSVVERAVWWDKTIERWRGEGLGADITKLRKEHPRMRFIGHFDRMTMTRDEGAMRAEFGRLLPTAAGGGFIIGCDHQTPPGVSYSEYRLYLSLFREYAQEAGRMSRDLLNDHG